MTTPGGVPNLPAGALTLDTLATKLQDMSGTAMKNRAVERFPSIFNNSTGLDPSLDITPFGILTRIWAEVNSLIANADPADVQSPEDLPPLVLQFIEGLPVIGQFVELFEAILGTYTGDDTTLLGIQTLFAPIRVVADVITSVAGGGDLTNLTAFFDNIPLLPQLIALFPGATGGLSGLGGLGSIFGDLTGLLGSPSGLGSGTPTLPGLGSIPLLAPLINGLLNGGQGVNALNIFGQLGQGLFGLIPASAIGSNTPNLLNNGGFDGLISMDGSGVWVWDSAVGHTTVGAARTTADGTLKALLSNAIDVAPSQVLSPSVWVKSSSYTGSGTPIRLAVRAYSDTGAAGATTVITSAAGPGSTWTQLSGSYTVPSSGVAKVRLRLVVDTTATGGQVWFDDATLTKPGNGPFDGILDLFGLSALEDLFGPDVAAIWENLPIIGQILDIFNGASSLTEALSFITDLLTLLGNPTAMGTGSPTADPVGRIPIIGGLLDFLFNGLTGAGSTGADQTLVGAATASQTDAVAGQGALIEQIKAALGAGTPDSDDFERATLGSAWTFVSSSGTGTIPDAHNFHFSGNTTAAEFVMRKNDKVSATDHITSTIVLNQAIPVYFFFPLPYGGNIDVWVRQTAFTTYATRTGARLRINSNGAAAAWNLDWVSSGTVTALSSGSCPIPAAGAAVSLEAGAGGNMRRFLATLNGSPICDFTDTGLVTTIGSSNRYRGFGGRGTNGVGANQGTPDIRQWTATG